MTGSLVLGLGVFLIAWLRATNKWVTVQEEIFDGKRRLRYPSAIDDLRGLHLPSEHVKKSKMKRHTITDDEVDPKKTLQMLKRKKELIREAKKRKRDIARRQKMEDEIAVIQQRLDENLAQDHSGPCKAQVRREKTEAAIKLILTSL
ncbi:hypothetical protein XENTR_v10008231 [Xenopus tropicalis]|nr:hypothetical protein XENTR_v10008231 [Xenopus tropicalis]KAE8614591.1 hypothetical protein XENTR_v10008231 [Xenopus tropicalis]